VSAVVHTKRRPAVLASEERPRILGRLEVRRLAEPGRATLSDRIAATWTRLVDEGVAECPVCASELRAGSGCSSCGSVLS
jgi:hypothetical protein